MAIAEEKTVGLNESRLIGFLPREAYVGESKIGKFALFTVAVLTTDENGKEFTDYIPCITGVPEIVDKVETLAAGSVVKAKGAFKRFVKDKNANPPVYDSNIRVEFLEVVTAKTKAAPSKINVNDYSDDDDFKPQF